MTAPGLQAHLRVERPGFRLELALDVAPGEVVALLGPNGAGKTTAVRALAGLVPLAGGQVLLAGAPQHDLPPERRRVGFVPQDALLLPHLSALRNVAYGLRAGGTRKADAHERAAHELAEVGLADRAQARPDQLSGGQAQRVALARALAVDPSLLLLDEPLSALDALARTHLRTALRRRLTGVAAPTVLVTHDLLDALVLADRVVVLEHGQVVQEGSVEDLTGRPRTPYVAGLVGRVLVRPRPDDPRLGGRAAAYLAYSPEDVELHDRAAPGGWAVRITGLEQHGSRTKVHLDDGTHVLVPTGRAAALDAAQQLWARVAPERVEAY